VLRGFFAETVVWIEEDNIRTTKRVALARCPRTSMKAWRHWLTVEQRSFWPNRRPFECSNTAFRQCGERSVKLIIKHTPRRFVAPFQMSSVSTSVIARSIVPGDAKPAILGRQRAQEGEF
jgi:hypothetical protein